MSDQLDFLGATSGVQNTDSPDKNYRMLGDRGLAKTWRERAQQNIEAIALSTKIEAEGRPATPAEQERLMRFVGFGATEMATSLFPLAGQSCRKGWEALGEALRAAVTPEQFASLSRSTQYAHYTPEFMVRRVWSAVRRMGFRGGAILEAGCGTGLFFALMRREVAAASVMVGIEADEVTARIARLVHPEAQITQADFTQAKLPAGFDLAIGNPPFSSRTVKGKDELGRLGLSLHEYFVARAIRLLRPGGVAAFVVSRYLMDKHDKTARAYIGGMADLLGAIRMPQAAMRADAGTDAVVDLLFLRKRDGSEAAAGHEWLDADAVVVENPERPSIGVINRYFAANPRMVLGTHAIASSQFGPAYAVKAPAGSLELALSDAIELLPADVYSAATEAPEMPGGEDDIPAPEVSVGTAGTGAAIKEGSYFVDSAAALLRKHDLYAKADYASGEERKRLLRLAAEAGQDPGTLWQIVSGKPEMIRVKIGGKGVGIFGKHAAIVRDLIPIRNAVRAVLRAQEANQPWEDAQADLGEAYRTFTAAHGPINLTKHIVTKDPVTGEEKDRVQRPNITPFIDDPDCWLVASIEEYDDDTRTARPGPIFTERVIRAPSPPSITCPTDALAVTLNERGLVDLDRIAQLLRTSVEEAITALGDSVFHNPETKRWETSEEYLSGLVRTKLADAKAAAEDPAYARNVAALESVQPKDLPPSEITVRLGAPWIPADVVSLFIKEVIGVKAVVYHTPEIASWSVTSSGFDQNASTTSEWGTSRRNAHMLIEDALNSRTPAIYDITEDAEGNEHRVLNTVDTEAAKERLDKIRAAFQRWAWTDGGRADRLIRLYNDTYNNLIPRRFNGSHMTLPGANPAIPVSEHQRRAIWRGVATGNLYLAHAVGAGKTRTIVALVMEQRRLGLVTKSMIVVPGHTLTQWAREFLALYPTARILVADETNFAKEKRARFIARAATGNWDAIIITHSAFKFIATPTKFERKMIRDQIAELEEVRQAVDADSKLTRKKLEEMKESLSKKLENLIGRKDNMVTIAEIGVDQILVDEAQSFRKLSFITNQTNVLGITPEGSQRAWDLWVKSRFVATINPGRELVLASGTPVTNTMGEMFTLLRFLAEDDLRDRNIHQFDAWAANFCETRTELELMPSGKYRPVTRFAEFVNIPELAALFRTVADVLTKEELRPFMKLPRVATGRRQIVTAPAAPAFRAYQRVLSARIDKIKERGGRPEPGQDIILSVIGDGRHAAIDMRFTNPEHELDRYEIDDESLLDFDWDEALENDPANKLNVMIDNAFRIWRETSGDVYLKPNGEPYPIRGAAQMIFSDLGTLAAADKRGFSAYAWIKTRLVTLGVPAEQIAFMQHFKKAEAKRRLFDDVNGGKVRFLIGSSETMGTGVNAQTRLKALHHLDVPWFPAMVEQREGRIERQGNQNEEIAIYAYATLGSMDAPMWQTNERKQRFINAALAGDCSLRRLEDIGNTVEQFAMAKAIASGDPRLMQKSGLEAELNRLYRLRSAHIDDQHAVRSQVEAGHRLVASYTRRISGLESDLSRHVSTRGDAFRMAVDGVEFTERKAAGAALLTILRAAEADGEDVDRQVGEVGGFPLHFYGKRITAKEYALELTVDRENPYGVELSYEMGTFGIISRIEHAFSDIEAELRNARYRLEEAQKQVESYSARIGLDFEYEEELHLKEAEVKELNASLAADEKDAANDSDGDQEKAA